MTFQSYAQEFFVMDRSMTSPASQLHVDDNAVAEVHHHHHFPMHEEHKDSEHKHSEHEKHHEHHVELVPQGMEPLEVQEPLEIEIVIDELPGAPEGTPDPVIEVEEEPVSAKEEDDDQDADSKKGKKKDEKWDWEAHGPHGFVAWIKSRLDSVPKHSGYDSAGLERAMAFMERLDNEISKAMRMDLDGELDADKIEKVRSELDEGLSRLQDRLEKVKSTKKSKKRKKKSEYIIDEDGFIKEAQKITGVQGIYVTVPLLISRIARVCINGMVSAGKDIEQIYHSQVKKYALTDREQAEVQQLLFDMGFQLRQDRGHMPDDDIEVSDSDNFDWAANYKA